MEDWVRHRIHRGSCAQLARAVRALRRESFFSWRGQARRGCLPKHTESTMQEPAEHTPPEEAPGGPEAPGPITAADLVFSTQANHNFSRILTDLKRANLSMGNRLRSIVEDAEFVATVAAALRRPLVANERCGSWYMAPEAKGGSAYFKSTDGHAGQWRFSTRRLNLHLLPLVGRHDGVIVVDSTRRGKRMPDALSKTVPVWCCVLNRVLFPAGDNADEAAAAACHALYTPPHVVAASEHAQMLARIPDFVDAFRALGPDLAALRAQVVKPLRPFWITRESPMAAAAAVDEDEDAAGPPPVLFDDFHPVVCCTSSRRVPGGEMSEAGYIQGAGDDTENWALGLEPALFWRHRAALLAVPEADLPGLVRALVTDAKAAAATIGGGEADETAVKALGDRLLVGPLTAAAPPDAAVITVVPQATDAETWVRGPDRMDVGLGKLAKLAGRGLRAALPRICEFATYCLSSSTGPAESSPLPPAGRRLLIRCETGRDLSVGIALALTCRLFDDAGRFDADEHEKKQQQCVVNKAVIKVRLGRIMTLFPEANPSRATLQSVNSFLMG